MGCTGSKGVGPKDDIDRQLQLDASRENLCYKILLLGCGESGKSTVLKQVKLIYKGKMQAKDLQQCSLAIRKNALECMQVILRAMPVLGIPLGTSSSTQAARDRVLALDDRDDATSDASFFTQLLADDISALWADAGVLKAYDQREKYWLLDGAAYYFDNCQRLVDPEYVPTDEDVVMTRIRTSGIDNTEFDEPPRKFTVVDVGGQRNERRKWIHCFDNVRGVVFLVGLSGYNQVLFEDTSVNRMQESLKLFQAVAGNPIFQNVPIFLFLNKKDLFESMIRKTSLRVCFPDYTGPDNDVHAALQFVEGKFHDVMNGVTPGKKLYVHVVAARVRMDMKIAWGDVKESIKAIYSDQGEADGKALLSAARSKSGTSRA
jgi:GTPase SAR1 family protein